MKGEKEQPDFIAEAFKMKIISAFPPANEQMIIHVLSSKNCDIIYLEYRNTGRIIVT